MFIELTGLNNNKVFIKVSSVEGIVHGERKTKVFTKGALVPYEVKENAEEVISKIKKLEENNEINETEVLGFLFK